MCLYPQGPIQFFLYVGPKWGWTTLDPSEKMVPHRSQSVLRDECLAVVGVWVEENGFLGSRYVCIQGWWWQS